MKHPKDLGKHFSWKEGDAGGLTPQHACLEAQLGLCGAPTEHFGEPPSQRWASVRVSAPGVTSYGKGNWDGHRDHGQNTPQKGSTQAAVSQPTQVPQDSCVSLPRLS